MVSHWVTVVFSVSEDKERTKRIITNVRTMISEKNETKKINPAKTSKNFGSFISLIFLYSFFSFSNYNIDKYDGILFFFHFFFFFFLSRTGSLKTSSRVIEVALLWFQRRKKKQKKKTFVFWRVDLKSCRLNTSVQFPYLSWVTSLL